MKMLDRALIGAVNKRTSSIIITILIKFGANPNATMATGFGECTPVLGWAVATNPNPDVIAALIKGGADVRIAGILDRCELNSNKESVLSILLAAGATNRGDPKRMSFVELCKYGTPDDVQQAIDTGADVSKRNQHGGTCLMDAIYNSDPSVITLLARSGADVNAQTVKGQTALMIAAMEISNPEVISALLNAGADPNLQNHYGWTALKWAAQENPYPEVITTLIRGGADVKFPGLLDACANRNKNKDKISSVLKAAGATS